ncbi:predicted protein [Sclerotinia sclerotiorum 1980 UF-70]|uniref:Uncharacterized protein n=1 Tax=Sclerotinia sclerotiorum (strain ATCC 18683 / 1980 / Ss-1) TaxID=665079 RepID=A7EX41_SCLS1|nr:predicted protein [Sclerotinia sclerotiorum 1980 UF-70]EDN94033.1 predicted protein [Sclerotinia sclerotiorum 1980 UF-70]
MSFEPVLGPKHFAQSIGCSLLDVVGFPVLVNRLEEQFGAQRYFQVLHVMIDGGSVFQAFELRSHQNHRLPLTK